MSTNQIVLLAEEVIFFKTQTIHLEKISFLKRKILKKTYVDKKLTGSKINLKQIFRPR